MYRPGLVHPNDRERYSRTRRYYKLLSKAPPQKARDREVDDLVRERTTDELDLQRARVKTEMRRALQGQLKSAGQRTATIEEKLLAAKREFGMLPDVASPESKASDNGRSPTADSRFRHEALELQRPRSASPTVARQRMLEQSKQQRRRNTGGAQNKSSRKNRPIKGASAG